MRSLDVIEIYERGQADEMLVAEYSQLLETVADLSDEQAHWRPRPEAKCVLDILWHLAIVQLPEGRPHTLAGALAGLAREFEFHRARHIGDGPARACARHFCFHLGELVYLRQAQGLDLPRYYHEE